MEVLQYYLGKESRGLQLSVAYTVVDILVPELVIKDILERFSITQHNPPNLVYTNPVQSFSSACFLVLFLSFSPLLCASSPCEEKNKLGK